MLLVVEDEPLIRWIGRSRDNKRTNWPSLHSEWTEFLECGIEREENRAKQCAGRWVQVWEMAKRLLEIEISIMNFKLHDCHIYPAIALIFDKVFYSYKYLCDGFIYFVGLLVGVWKLRKRVEFNIRVNMVRNWDHTIDMTRRMIYDDS